MRIRHLLLLSIASLAILVLQNEAKAQDNKTFRQSVPRVPMPVAIPTTINSKNYIGLELGLTWSTLTGSDNFQYPYDWPFMDDFTSPERGLLIKNLGSGFGFLAGGVVDLRLSDAVGLVGKLNFHTNHTGSSETEQFYCKHTDPFTLLTDSALTNQTREYSSTLSYFSGDLMLRVQFVEDGLYGLAGIGSSFLVGNSLEQSFSVEAGTNDCQFLTSSGALTGIRSFTVGSRSTSDFFNSNREDFKVGLGTYIPLSDGMVLSPELIASIPFTSYLASDTAAVYENSKIDIPSLWTVTLSVALKFPFGGGPSSDVARSETTYGDASSSSSSSTTSGMVHLRGKVTDANGKPVNANITVTDLGTDQVVRTGKTDDGNYDFEVKSPGKYSVTADAEGYLFGSAYFEVDKDGRILKGKHDITLSPASGRTRLLVFFDFDKDDLQPESFPELSRAVSLMKSNPKMQVEIAGYTDAKGSDAYNIDLSQRRATSVRDYLVKHGIEKNRITAKGYGKEQPIASNDTDEGRAENRRVEFVVIKR
jgi:outer membrane protein OmpA-like peptidoglycan-associated protein